MTLRMTDYSPGRFRRDLAYGPDGTELGLLPGFVSTGEVQTAMRYTKDYIDELDEQIHGALCRRMALPTGQEIPFFNPLYCEKTELVGPWNTFRLGFNRWFADNEDYGSRFVDTNALYDQAREYLKRANAWRTTFEKAKVSISVPPAKVPEERRGIFDSLSEALRGAVKWAVIIGGAVFLGPPLLRLAASRIEAAPRAPQRRLAPHRR